MSQNSVYIIGAGASKEANLPTGHELKIIISNLLNMKFNSGRLERGDHLIVEALRSHVLNSNEEREGINPYIQEAHHINGALPLAISIDNFIDSQRGNIKLALCGKLAIVRSILKAEKDSTMYFEKYSSNPEINFSSLDKTWYLSFFQLLTENCELSEIEERFKSVTLIVFNYDRCIEHFIFNALKKYYHVTDVDAANLVKYIKIYHPYGSVGSLPWQDEKTKIEFGAEVNANELLSLTNKIKTFTEGTDPNASDIISIKKHVCIATKLVFIGFAYHKLNMDLIAPKKCEGPGAMSCYATAYGISKSDTNIINQQLSNLHKNHISVYLSNSKCSDFFSEFKRGLSF